MKDPKTTEEWVDLGMVTNNTATFAIVEPKSSRALADWWDEYIHVGIELERGNLPAYREVDLKTTWARTREPDQWYTTSESAVLFDSPSNGGYRVWGRFDDPFGYRMLVEVRIVLFGDEDDEDDELNG